MINKGVYVPDPNKSNGGKISEFELYCRSALEACNVFSLNSEDTESVIKTMSKKSKNNGNQR